MPGFTSDFERVPVGLFEGALRVTAIANCCSPGAALGLDS